MERLRNGYSDDGFSGLYDRLASVSVLALDELDKVRLTEWAKEKLYQLCDARYRDRDRKGTLFAMNIQPATDNADFGYLFSRMRDYYGCKVVEVAGGDVRPVERKAA